MNVTLKTTSVVEHTHITATCWFSQVLLDFVDAGSFPILILHGMIGTRHQRKLIGWDLL